MDHHMHPAAPYDARPMSPSTVTLPNPAVQTYMHELAKSMPVSRKQNSACDACRSRKVKCNRIDGQDKCQHCLSKNYPCTNHVQQATTEKRRTVGVQRRQRGMSSAGATQPYPKAPSANDMATDMPLPRMSAVNGYPYAVMTPMAPVASSSQDAIEASPIRMGMPVHEMLLYMFAPPAAPPGVHAAYSRADLYARWGPEANKLDDPRYRNQVAEDLVEVFFQIVHSRWPMLSPDDFRRRLNLRGDSDLDLLPSPMSSSGSLPGTTDPHPSTNGSNNGTSNALHPAIVATVLAWGAKFTEHILFISDRSMNGGQGLIAKTIIERARAVAEVMKVQRIATPEHVIVGLLLEPVQPLIENPDDPSGFQGYWLNAAVKHLQTLQYNRQSVVVNIPDSGTRQIMIFCWWMACLCDAYSSAYYRRKPTLDDDDYNVEVYTVNSLDDDQPTTPHQLELIGYYNANHALARIARNISKQLWKPVSEELGVPVAALRSLFRQLRDWKAAHLHQVGVPADSSIAASWDFLAAISACASDATYHIMWVIMFNAVDDFGVRDDSESSSIMDSPRSIDESNAAEEIKEHLFDEALHGALRIAGLAGVLASNGYLRLDTAVMHVSCIQAGLLLARLGRPEVQNCIAALQQYSFAYEEAAEQGLEIERIYQNAVAGERDLGRMANVVYQRQISPTRTSHSSV